MEVLLISMNIFDFDNSKRLNAIPRRRLIFLVHATVIDVISLEQVSKLKQKEIQHCFIICSILSDPLSCDMIVPC